MYVGVKCPLKLLFLFLFAFIWRIKVYLLNRMLYSDWCPGNIKTWATLYPEKFASRKFRYCPLVKWIRWFYFTSCLLWKKLANGKIAIFPTSEFKTSEFWSSNCLHKAFCQLKQSWGKTFYSSWLPNTLISSQRQSHTHTHSELTTHLEGRFTIFHLL